MLGHWELGSEALGAVSFDSGSYIYAVSLGWQFGMTAEAKLGVIYPPELETTLGFSAGTKVGIAHAVTFGLTFASDGVEKFGASYPSLFNLTLGAGLASTLVELHRVGEVGFTLGAEAAVKMGYVTVSSPLGVAFAESATVKAGAKLSSSSGFALNVSSSVLINGVIAANSSFTLGSNVTIKWQPRFDIELEISLELPSTYNPGYATRPELSPLTIEFGNVTTWELGFWSKELPASGNMWVGGDGVVNSWTPDQPVTSNWTKDQAA